MRAIVLALAATHVLLSIPTNADTGDTDRSIGEKLPLFAQNHCEQRKDPAEQLFCGDPALAAAAAKLSEAIEERLNRLPDRLPAIGENAHWIRERNLSCGIFGDGGVRYGDIDRIKACLFKETEERIAILLDRNFDCLAANTAAGALICSDPSLALAEATLNEAVLGLIRKLKEDEAQDAFSEYARWIRERDRRCNLAGKENVPLRELTPSEPCLAEYLDRKTADILAAKGDPRRALGQPATSRLPNADAVDLCVTRIHAANGCGSFVRINRVFEIDSEVSDQDALVTAEVEMVVLSPFGACSQIASGCTGTCWDPKSGRARASSAAKESFNVARRLSVERTFVFRKHGEEWRCAADALPPIDFGAVVGGL